MDIEKYIASGVLELYVAGLLSEKENLEVDALAQQYPEIKTEIIAIETAILALSKSVSPGVPSSNLSGIHNRIHKVRTLDTPAKKQTNWLSYTGWAAAILFAAGLLWMYNQNNTLKSNIEVVNQEKLKLKDTLNQTKSSKIKTETLLEELRDQNVAVVALGGQAVSPESFAKAYWNKEENKVFIDASGLPEPPEGYTYQVWSLKLEPLTPSSLGLLDDFAVNDTKVFEFENANESEAFGITLEPAGGSESPTLEQLYTLGAVGA